MQGAIEMSAELYIPLDCLTKYLTQKMPKFITFLTPWFHRAIRIFTWYCSSDYSRGSQHHPHFLQRFIMLWLKALHLIFMVAWFAGIFYLPRLFINHAMTDNPDTIAQFKQIERKLYRFTTPWMLLTLIFGTWMLVDYAWAVYSHSIWLHLK
jgi:hypothetical protein